MKKYLLFVFVLSFLIGICSAQVPVTMQCQCTCVTETGNVTTTTTIVGPTTVPVTTTTIPIPVNPTITRLDPSCVRPTTPGEVSTVSVRVFGYNFAQNSVIFISDVSISNAFVSETELIAIIPSSYLINNGDKSIFIRTRNKPQSNTVSLTVSNNCSSSTTVPITTTSQVVTTTTTSWVTTTTLEQLGTLKLYGFQPDSLPMNSGEQIIKIIGENFPTVGYYNMWLYFPVRIEVSNGESLYVRVMSSTEAIVLLPASYTTLEALYGMPQDYNNDYILDTFLYYHSNDINQKSDPVMFRIRPN